MKLVAKNAKRGAQFTPQGLLRYPLASPKPDDVLAEVRALLDQLALTGSGRLMCICRSYK